MSTTSAQPSCQCGVPNARLGPRAEESILEFSITLSRCPVNVPTMFPYTVPDPTGWEMRGRSPVLAGGSGVSFAGLGEFALV